MIISRILLFFIQAYRFILSPYLGCHCRFYPTCSEYAQQAITNFGAFTGVYLTLKRLCRCHPWHQGGIDPIANSIPNLDR